MSQDAQQSALSLQNAVVSTLTCLGSPPTSRPLPCDSGPDLPLMAPSSNLLIPHQPDPGARHSPPHPATSRNLASWASSLSPSLPLSSCGRQRDPLSPLPHLLSGLRGDSGKPRPLTWPCPWPPGARPPQTLDSSCLTPDPEGRLCFQRKRNVLFEEHFSVCYSFRSY